MAWIPSKGTWWGWGAPEDFCMYVRTPSCQGHVWGNMLPPHTPPCTRCIRTPVYIPLYPSAPTPMRLYTSTMDWLGMDGVNWHGSDWMDWIQRAGSVHDAPNLPPTVETREGGRARAWTRAGSRLWTCAAPCSPLFPALDVQARPFVTGVSLALGSSPLDAIHPIQAIPIESIESNPIHRGRIRGQRGPGPGPSTGPGAGRPLFPYIPYGGI